MNKNNDFLSHFSFHTMPFTREIRVEDRFAQDSYDQALKSLYRVVNKRMSAALIAPAGTGKTMILRCLAQQLPEARYRIHYVKVTGLSRRDLCREIATAVGAEGAGTYPMLVRRIQEHFSTALDIDGIRPVMLLDEAHSIRPEVLGILSILTNFDMDSRLVVSIILAGQSPLKKLLRREPLQDVAQRMAHYATLRPLSQKELVLYVKHRCNIAGNSACPFDTDALTALFEIARGNPRASDYLALKSLEVAHDNNCDLVNANHIIEARGMLWA